MWNLFYRNSRLLILTICLILVWGLSSFSVLPRMEDPHISQWYGKITTSFPGATAQRVESLVTDKLEQELLKMEEIKTISSTSRLGSSTMILKLQDNVGDLDEVWSRVRDRLADVTPTFPPGVLTPKYEEVHQRAYSLMVALTWDLEDSPANYAILRRIAEELKDRLRSLDGTEEIEFFGAPSEEIIVEINPVKLAALGLIPQDISQQIRISDAKVSSGIVRNNQNNLLLETKTELDSLGRIRQIPIAVGNNSNQLARLGDLALVKKGIQEPAQELAIINGQPGIVLAVRIEPNIRIDRWIERTHQVLEEFGQSISRGMSLQLLLDQSIYVKSRLTGLFKNLFLGALCVVVSTALFMGWRSAIVVGSAIPLSILMVFGGMRLLGIPLHQMSVTGLVIALGMLIDNAIVVVDEMQNLLRSGFSPAKAISKTVGHIAIPLTASTLTTVLTFLPIALIPGDTGEFVRTISLSVILALLSSLLLSVTIIPVLNGRMQMLKNQGASKNQKPTYRNWSNSGISLPGLTKIYRQQLNSVLARPGLGVLLALILPVTGFLVAGTLPEQFFPPADRDQVHIELELPLASSLEQTQAVVESASGIISDHPEVTNLSWFLGTHAPRFYYNISARINKGGVSNYAAAMVQLTSAQESRELIQKLQKELDFALPEAQILVKQIEQGPPFAPIELRLIGPNLDILRELGNQARAELAQIANVTHIRNNFGEALPQLALSLDEEQTRLSQLNHTQIAQQLNASLEGIVGGSILEDIEEVPVRVRLGNGDRANLNQITTLDLVPQNQLASNSPSLPLSALGQINLVPETAIITRRNGQRVNTIKGFITAGVLPSTVLADFQQRLHNSNFQLPPGYSMEWGGESAESNEARSNLLSTVGILLVLMVAILVLSFNSFRSAGIILLVAIGSVGLALLCLWLFGYPLGFMSILGTVGLIGVAINDSIVVLAAIRNDPLASKGDRQAMIQVIVRSTRHVLTTTITTIAGFIPLFLDGGEFWPPLAICIAGGVVGTTLFAIFFVPCTYLMLISRNRLHSHKFADQRTSYQLKKTIQKHTS